MSLATIPRVCRYFLAATYGYTVKDKILITVNRILHLAYPLNHFCVSKLGYSIIQPTKLTGYFKCKDKIGVFKCHGNDDLQFLEGHESGVGSQIATLKGGVFIDVGASIGKYTVMASKKLGTVGKVVSIEPHAATFNILQENVALNQCKNVSCVNMACWFTPKRMILFEHVFGGSPLDHSLVNSTGKGQPVQADRLDQILTNINVDVTEVKLVKIDVEGAELGVFKGMTHILSGGSPVIVFECLNGKNLLEASELLQSHGYAVSMLEEGNFIAKKTTAS